MPENDNEFSWTDHYPRALNSVYTTSEPNKPIALYNGAIEVGEGDTASKFQGNIELTWQPRYAVELQVSGNDTMDLFSRARSQITVPARGVSASGLWTEIASSLLEEIVFTRAENLSEVMFHLPNGVDALLVGPVTILKCQRLKSPLRGLRPNVRCADKD